MLWDSLDGMEKRNGGWNLLCMPGMRHRTRSSKVKTSQEMLCYIPSQKSPGWKRMLELCRNSKASGCFKYKSTSLKNNIQPPNHQEKLGELSVWAQSGFMY